jgi:uncharacterized membrane protein YkvA (DUF1232 family)
MKKKTNSGEPVQDDRTPGDQTDALVYPTATQTFLPMLEARLESGISRILAPMCVALPVEEIPQLEKQVRLHVEEIRRALAQNEFLDVATVERMADVLTGLLNEYETYPEMHRALIVGAARYFAKADDAEPDTVSLLGFDDDVAVLNYVLEAVGLGELKIEL